MSKTDPQILPGPCSRADIEKKKAELCESLVALHQPFSSGDNPSKGLLAVTQLEKHFFQWSNELAIYREAGGVFKCSFKATHPVESDSITVTSQGRIMLAQGGVVSVVLPDELNSIYSGSHSGRWGRTAVSLSTSFVLHWLRQRPNHNPESLKTQVFFNEDGKEFEAVIRALISTRRQSAWRQAQELARRVTQIETGFDIGISSHRAGLIQFWNCCYPNEPLPRPSRTLNRESTSAFWANTWEQIGFPNGDLNTAFYGTGILGLEQLLYFATHHQDTLHQVMGRAPGEASVDIGITGFAITKMLIGMQFQTGCITAPLLVETTNSFTKQSPLARLLLQCSSSEALEMVFCIALETCLDLFRSKFNNDTAKLAEVVFAVESTLHACLTNLPMSIPELEIMMKLEHPSTTPVLAFE